MSNYRLKYSGEKIDEILTKADGMSEVVAATGETAGKVKLSDATDSESDASAGVAATPKAVKAAFDAASAAGKTAGDLSTKVEQNTTAISENATAIGKLEKDINNLSSSKISKFYASSQGNTNLPDSDNGKIIDLKLYGKSSQQQYSGKNLLTGIEMQKTTKLGITIEPISATEIKVTGTATDKCQIDTWGQNINVPKGANLLCKVLQGSKFGSSYVYLYARNYAQSVNAHFDKISTKSASEDFICAMIRIGVNAGESVDCVIGLSLQMDSSTSYEPYVGGIPSPNPEYPQEIKSVVKPVVTISDGADKQQTATLPYTLNAIPVSSGGNVTIDGQKYIADYVDIERGKLVRMCKELTFTGDEVWNMDSTGIWTSDNGNSFYTTLGYTVAENGLLSNVARFVARYPDSAFADNCITIAGAKNQIEFIRTPYKTVSDFKAYLKANSVKVLTAPDAKNEIDLTVDEIAAFKALVSYYPVTNVSTTSEQLDGYTVFNYPISLANGWNYVKQQIGDTRDYLYDIDLVTAEAYVNSAYATALAEMEI